MTGACGRTPPAIASANRCGRARHYTCATPSGDPFFPGQTSIPLRGEATATAPPSETRAFGLRGRVAAIISTELPVTDAGIAGVALSRSARDTARERQQPVTSRGGRRRFHTPLAAGCGDRVTSRRDRLRRGIVALLR